MGLESADPDRLAALAALGLGPEAKARDIISAYRRLARQSHPDLATPGSPPDQTFAAISEAYQLLTRGARRASVEASSELERPETPPPHPVSLRREPGVQPIFVAGPVIIRPFPQEST